MFEITIEMTIKLREIRAKKRNTLKSESQEIGISSKTLSLLERGKKHEVRKTVYEKIIKHLFLGG